MHSTSPRLPLSPLPLVLRSAVLASLLAASTAGAVDYFWDADGNGTYGGSGSWNRISESWWVSSGAGSALSTWGFGTHSGDTAVFSGGAGQYVVTAAGWNFLFGPINVGNLRFSSADYTLSGTSLVLSGSGNVSTITVDAPRATISSVLEGSTSAAGLTKAGAGTLTLSGNNTYLGATTVTAGTLNVNGTLASTAINIGGGTLALGANERLADTSAVTVSGGTLAIGNYTETVGVVKLTSGSITGGPTGRLTGSTYDLQSGTVSARLGGGTGVALTKSTTGTVILSGLNSYTGATTITGGTLAVNGALYSGVTPPLQATTVGAAGTLAGTGTVNGTVAVYGELAPGGFDLNGTASIGTLTTGSQTWYDGASYAWQVNNTLGAAGTAYDTLVIDGSLNLSNLSEKGFTLEVLGLAGTLAGTIANFDGTWSPTQYKSYTWTLLTASDGITGFDADYFRVDTTNFANAFDPTHGNFFVGIAGGDSLTLTYESVPEPATYAALLGAATLGFAGVRRWRQRRAAKA